MHSLENIMNAELLKSDAIKMFKTMLPQIPFNTVYSYADILFDLRNELFFNDPAIQKQVDFFKNTKLSEMVYFNTEKPDFFTVTNSTTGESIQISNRLSTRGELRGEKLRSILEQQKKENPDELMLDAITRTIRTLDCSDMGAMLRGALSQGEAAQEIYGTSMSEGHFNLLTELLLTKVKDKMENHALEANLEPKNIRDNQELQKEIWSGIDVSGLYDATKALTENLQKVDALAKRLDKQGNAKASTAARTLYEGITSRTNEFIDGRLSIKDFRSQMQSVNSNGRAE